METADDAEKHVAEIRRGVDEVLHILDDSEKQKDVSEKRKLERDACEKAKKVISGIQIYGDHLETIINGSKKFKEKISGMNEDDTIRAQKKFLAGYVPFMERKSRELKQLQSKLTHRGKIREYVVNLGRGGV